MWCIHMQSFVTLGNWNIIHSSSLIEPGGFPAPEVWGNMPPIHFCLFLNMAATTGETEVLTAEAFDI